MNQSPPPQPGSRQVLDFVVKAGVAMLRNGAELYRVQQTMYAISQSFGVEQLHIYVIANGLFASVEQDGEVHSSQIRHVPLSSVHLGRVVALSNLSREITGHRYTLEQANRRLDEILAIPYSSSRAQILGAGLGSACFCYLFGGAVPDCLAALLSGLLLYWAILQLGQRGLSKIVVNILGSALVTCLGIWYVRLLPGLHLDSIIIGSIIPMVPGVPLTTAIRDFLNADYLSGTIRLIDTLLVAFSIAMGVGLVLRGAQIALWM